MSASFASFARSKEGVNAFGQSKGHIKSVFMSPYPSTMATQAQQTTS